MAKKRPVKKASSSQKDPKRITATIYDGDKEITAEKAKQLLGWKEEPENTEVPWKTWDFKLDGKKVRFENNGHNRPLRLSLAKKWGEEMGRKKWRQNGETITFDWNGQIVSGQHRLIGVILAEHDRIHKGKWKDCTGGVSFPAIIVRNVDPSSADTADLGQKRSLGDVLYRRREFGEAMDSKTQKKMADNLAHAVRLVWLRMGGKKVSDAPSFPHSEALDFLQLHPKIQDSVDHIFMENGGQGADGNKIKTYISLGYAAGLHYLMATCGSDLEEDRLSFEFEDRANEFWTLLASGAGLEADNPILHARNLIIKVDQSTGSSRDYIVGVMVKAWNLWVDGDTATAKKVNVRKTKDPDTGKMILAEYPRIGGLDIEIEEEDDEEWEYEDE